MQLAEHERSIDKQTGLPLEVAYDPKQAWRVDHTTNYAKKAIDTVLRAENEKPENKERPGWDAGRIYYAEPIDTPGPNADPSNLDSA